MTSTAVQELTTPLPALAGRLITGYAAAQLVFVAAALRLGDHLAAAPLSAAALADATGTRADRLERILRGLTVIGLVTSDLPDRFRLTPLGALVCGSGQFSMRDLVLCGEESYRAWGELLPCLSNGETPFARAHGMTRWEYLAHRPERERLFNAAMAGMARGIASQILQRADLDGVGTIVDVGGGNGTLLAELLVADSRRDGVLFDRAGGFDGAHHYLQARGVADRCRLVEGDFLQSVPEGGDAYVLSHVLHNWEDEAAQRILENCGRGAPAGARLIVVEPVMSKELASSPAAYPAIMMDLQMLVMTGGRERTADEHRALFEAAGFELVRISRGDGPDGIIEGRRV